MKFFIDTADIDEISALVETGLVDGVTTNPTLIAQSGRDFKATIAEICSIVSGPVSAEVVSTDLEGMIREGNILADIAPNVAVKVPMTWDGLKACNHFARGGILVNVTLCFTLSQALLAIKSGAAFVSPFVGRLDDISQDGLNLIADICRLVRTYGYTTEVLVASVRHPIHVVESAKLGADIATVPPAVLKQLLNHPLTDKGLAAFLADWQQTGQTI